MRRAGWWFSTFVELNCAGDFSPALGEVRWFRRPADPIRRRCGVTQQAQLQRHQEEAGPMTTTLPGSTIPPQAPRPRSRGPLVIVALVAILFGAGVAVAVSSREGSDSDRISTLDGPDGTKPKTEAEKVEEAYRNYWDANFKAGEIPDPASPLLGVYATRTQLQAAASDLEKLRQQGLAGRAVPNSIARRQITVASVQGDTARLTDCAVDDSIIVRADSGKPAYDYPPGKASTTLFTAEMVREGGTWKVASLNRDKRWEGVAGCALGQS